jgi:hypothetical protein
MEYLQENFFNFDKREPLEYTYIDELILYIPLSFAFFLFFNYIISKIIFKNFLLTKHYLKLSKRDQEDWDSRYLKYITIELHQHYMLLFVQLFVFKFYPQIIKKFSKMQF